MKRKSLASQCTKVMLQDEADHTFLDISPTMKNITYKGRRYFQCRQSAGQDQSDGQWGMMYLWEGWGDWRYAQMKAVEAAT